MKRLQKIMPKYTDGLIGAVLVVIVVQYALITGVVRPGHLVSGILQLFCYLLLAVSVFRGFIQRSRLAWLVVQIMLAALFAFSVLFTAVSAVLTLTGGSFWVLLGLALLTAVGNGILMGILFSLPVCDYFSPRDDDDQ